jgi:hypothetical protein
LPDRADVDHHLFFTKPVFVIDFLGTVKLELLCKDARHVGVALERVLGDQGEDLFQLAAVVNVLREDIFVKRVSGRPMHEEELVLLMIPRQFSQEVPTFLAFRCRTVPVFQLHARPKDGPFGAGIESFRIEQGALVVVAQQANLALHHHVDAFARIGTVADEVAEAINLGDPLTSNIGKHGLESLEVAMDVADEGSFHAA